jgi:enamine deaminase RidA (YjgF/YER057c/UK114 family)
MTVYVTDLDAYRVSTRAIGAAWRTRFGKHFPAMALVAVTGLLEPRAKVEIETIAVVGHKDAAG